jgi:transcriptional regulator, propionate catabolism operon regulatory protein
MEVLRSIAPEVFDSPRAAAEASGAGIAAMTLRERSLSAQADEIRAALEACGGDRDRVCALLGISKTTLWRRLAATREAGGGPVVTAAATAVGTPATPTRRRNSR